MAVKYPHTNIIMDYDDMDVLRPVEVKRTSMVSGAVHVRTLPMTARQIALWNSGAYLIQEVFPNMSPDDREFLLTGITPEEWDAIYNDREENGEEV